MRILATIVATMLAYPAVAEPWKSSCVKDKITDDLACVATVAGVADDADLSSALLGMYIDEHGETIGITVKDFLIVPTEPVYLRIDDRAAHKLNKAADVHSIIWRNAPEIAAELETGRTAHLRIVSVRTRSAVDFTFDLHGARSALADARREYAAKSRK